MITGVFNPSDRRYIFFTGDNKELKLLTEHLNKIPKYMFLPSYSGIPKPEIFIRKFNKNDKTIYWCHSGLWHEIYTWCRSNGIAINGLYEDNDFKYTSFDWSKEKFTKWIKSLKLSLEMRDYQIDAAWLILKYRQSMSQLATRSGKTLIAYVILRWMLEFGGAHNILMIVPNTSLVKQGYNDMKEYKEFFSTETVWAKSELVEGSNLTIGTFQSLVNRLKKTSKQYNPKFFSKFDVVLCDECHKLQCKSIDMILSQPFMQHVKLRFGFSGTIPQQNTIENFACQSLMGPVIQDISTKELIDDGYLANVDIEQIKIRYNNDNKLKDLYIKYGEYLCGSYVKDNETGAEKKLLPKTDRRFLLQYEKTLPYSVKVVKSQYNKDQYIDYLVDLCKANGSNLLLLEQMIMFEQTRRVDVIKDILNSSNKNFIVFGHHREYLKYLMEHISAMLPNKICKMIIGATTQKNRENIIKLMETNDNCVLFASYSCVGTGLTFKNIDAGIFAESFKSEIINKQSLGRGLLLAPGKESFKLYDIIDCFPTHRIEFQGKRKKTIFTKEGFEVKETVA